RTALAAPVTPWLDNLAADFQVRPYVFDRDLRRVGDFNALDFSGQRTDLGKTLGRIRERFSGQPLAAVLLFTDGNATDLPAGLGDIAGLPPVYPVVIGDNNAPPDIRVERTDLRQTAFDDAPVSLRVAVAGDRAGGEPLAVTLRPLTAA